MRRTDYCPGADLRNDAGSPSWGSGRGVGRESRAFRSRRPRGHDADPELDAGPAGVQRQPMWVVAATLQPLGRSAWDADAASGPAWDGLAGLAALRLDADSVWRAGLESDADPV